MRIWLTSILAVVLFLLQSNKLSSQNSTPPKGELALQDSIFEISEVTVHAYHYERKLMEVPASISIISADQLEQNTFNSIDEVLNKVPGVYMQQATPTTNRLTIRGVGSRTPYASNKTRAYYAGIPLTNGVGETTIEDLNQSVLSKVEIIKGPSSGFYGAGLGGTLLFDAIHSGKDQLTVNCGLSSYQTHQTNAKLSLNGKNSSNHLAIESLSSAGYRRNNETNRINLNYVGQFIVGQHELNIIINQTDLKGFIPSSLNFETYQKSPEQAATNWALVNGYEDYQKSLLGASVLSHWQSNWQSTVVLFGQNRSSDELRPFNFRKEDSRYFGNRIILEKLITTTSGSWKLLLGNENFFENYDWTTFENDNDGTTGPVLSDNHEKRNYTNLFGQVEYKTSEKWRISLGANFNHTRYNYTDRILTDGDQSAEHSFNPVISPRLAINHALTTKNNIYAQISHGFSPPSLEETLLPEGGKNTVIQPETGWNYEVGSRGYLFDGFYYDFSVYFMKLENLLVARRVAEDAYLGINAGKTAHPGLEYYLEYKLPDSYLNWQHKFNVNGSFTPYYFIDFVDGEHDFSGNGLTGSPRRQSNLEYHVNYKRKLKFQLHYQMVGKIPLRDNNSVYSNEYGLLNLNVQYFKSFGKLQSKLFAGVNNITNEHYSSMVLINANSFGGNTPRYYYPGSPINFRMGVKLTYQL
ncbi:TonB-dependent receptor domain-containing protein [uncultured Sunxiuqinia sp.]|uniref:TonB-dependent receptor n=1 Tax=uncultured Sunxiuqinia sp. TaxID=1573825 RepID=UPI002AA7F0B6|nr:TonB-dependent receptor [uncultured Sunxiuqinia sp.]